MRSPNAVPRGFGFISGEAARKMWELAHRISLLLTGRLSAEPVFLPTLCSTHIYRQWEEGISATELMVWVDKKGRDYCFRPEGTMLLLAHLANVDKLSGRYFYFGPMFRYERPQLGRRREFYQLGYESIYRPSPREDESSLESLLLLWEVLTGLGIPIRLEINYLGTRSNWNILLKRETEGRAISKSRMIELLDEGKLTLKRSLATDRYEQEDLINTLRFLKRNKVEYYFNTGMYRGLHYYCRTIFEIKYEGKAIVGGGYLDDALESIICARRTHFGWGFGIQRLVELMGPR